MSNYTQRAELRGRAALTAKVDDFIASLAGQTIEAHQAVRLAMALQDATVDTREFLWVSTGFEAVADSFTKAIECAEDTDDYVDDSWIDRQDRSVETMLSHGVAA